MLNPCSTELVRRRLVVLKVRTMPCILKGIQHVPPGDLTFGLLGDEEVSKYLTTGEPLTINTQAITVRPPCTTRAVVTRESTLTTIHVMTNVRGGLFILGETPNTAIRVIRTVVSSSKFLLNFLCYDTS